MSVMSAILPHCVATTPARNKLSTVPNLALCATSTIA